LLAKASGQMKKTTGFLSLLIGIFALSFVPEPKPAPTLKRSATEKMWDALHLGQYDSINSVIRELRLADYYNPNDHQITAHLGFVHLWKFAERGRNPVDKSIADDVYRSNAYFKKAVRLNPYDPRLKGFLSATEFCKGALKKNIFTMAGGYVKARKAIHDWPQFNMFALSLVESQGGKNSLMFREGMKFQWQLVDECSCDTITEATLLANPDSVMMQIVGELDKTTDDRLKRACWNSWIAPHNLEGFLMNFGDMLVKQGRVEDARKIYRSARLSPGYSEWVYKDVLERRIVNANINASRFAKRAKIFAASGEDEIFVNSSISCVGCHQMSESEFQRWGCQYPGTDVVTVETFNYDHLE
jgi:hypothetical protein